MHFLGSLKNFFKIRLLFLIGVLNFWKSRLHIAEIAFIKILEIKPTHFKSHLYLGRIYIYQEDFPKAARVFIQAKEINYKKFKRYNIPLASLEDSLSNTEDLLWNYENFIQQFQKERERLRSIDNTGRKRKIPHQLQKKNREGRLKTFWYGDFSSFQEFKKFQNLPPITAQDIQNTDWEKLFRELQ